MEHLTTNSLLAYRHVNVAYGDHAVLHDINVCVHAGEIVGIVGESGSGKSTLLKAAMGLLGNGGALTKGQICYGGFDLAACSSEELRALRGARVAMIFQDCLSALTPTKTIASQMYEQCCAHATCAVNNCDHVVHAVTKDEVFSRAIELLGALFIERPDEVLASYPFELSGGIGQRVGIAMAMLLEPNIILADEPTSALDAVSQKQVLTEFVRLKQEKNTAVVLVSHNIAAVRAVADYVVVLKDGIVIEQGSAQEVLSAPQSAYTQELLAAVPTLKKTEDAYD